MTRTRTLIVLAVIATAIVTSGAAYGQGTNFVNQIVLCNKNDLTGQEGYQFNVGAAPITITALGRAIGSGMNSSHVVQLWTSSQNESGQHLLASVTVDSGSSVDSYNCAYAMLATSVTLEANKSYRVCSSETNGGDMWAGTYTVTSALAVIDHPIYALAQGQYPDGNVGGADGTGFASPTFYTSGGDVPEPGSMMALATGLVGMLGFGIRRRKA